MYTCILVNDSRPAHWGRKAFWMAVHAENEQIVLNELGEPIIAGTRIKVRMLAGELVYHGWTPEEIHAAHEPYVTLDQVRAALAYYRSHKTEIDEALRRDDELAEAMRQAAPPNPVMERLQEIKHRNGA